MLSESFVVFYRVLALYSRVRMSRFTVLVLAAAFAHVGWAAESVPQDSPQEEQAALRRAEATA